MTSYARDSGHKEECIRRQKKKFCNLQRRQCRSHSSSPSGSHHPASSTPHLSMPSLSSTLFSVSPPTPFPFPPPPPPRAGIQTPLARDSSSNPPFFASSATITSPDENAETSAHLSRDAPASIYQACEDLGRSSSPLEDQASICIDIEANTVVHHVHHPRSSINLAESTTS
ncbi:hypothetical protein SUGI_0713020 [Cryptomeria japonica]|nr:hypothetical protein SUGI_0713020 [Cryptomeria japonica]